MTIKDQVSIIQTAVNFTDWGSDPAVKRAVDAIREAASAIHRQADMIDRAMRGEEA